MTDHYTNTNKHLDAALEESRPELITALATVAQAEAILALADQQRVANLIALAESGRTTVNGARAALAALYTGSAEEGSAHMAIRPDIAQALRIETQ